MVGVRVKVTGDVMEIKHEESKETSVQSQRIEGGYFLIKSPTIEVVTTN